MKNIFLVLMLLLLANLGIWGLSGCGKNEPEVSVYEKVQKSLVDIKTYKCTANIKYISNKSTNEYTAEILAEESGKYRIETVAPESVKGNVILFDGKMIWQYNPKVKSKISINSPDKPERKEIFLFSFLKNYFNSQNVEVENENTENNSSYTILNAVISENNKYFSSEKLWIDENTLLPYKLVVYDKDKKERIVVIFENFEVNPKIDEKIFVPTIPENENK